MLWQSDQFKIINSIAIQEDIGCFSYYNVGRLASNNKADSSYMIPCTPLACLGLNKSVE